MRRSELEGRSLSRHLGQAGRLSPGARVTPELVCYLLLAIGDLEILVNADDRHGGYSDSDVVQ